MDYEAVIGLEVHVHLKTQTKAFCGCSTQFGSPANSQTCPVCLGLPGALPVLNKVALDYTIQAGLALSCQIQGYSKFDRKHYYYPDLPKNFQISQYDLPICRDGFLDIISEGKTKRIRIKRIHLEEDAGKLIHEPWVSLVDFNRSGIPLLEIVSEPDIYSAKQAYEYLVNLKGILEYLEISDCDMEKGSLRCDANISLRPQGTLTLGVKTEVKNMNSFKAVKEALAFEIERQIALLQEGKSVIQETRLWNVEKLKTFSLRTKEEAMDYRYFPEPDLPPFIISKEKIAEAKMAIPELPRQKIQRFMKEYEISEYDTKILVSSKKGADFAEGLIRAYPDKDKKPIVNWLIGPLLSLADDLHCHIADLKIPGGPAGLIQLVESTEEGKISYLVAKDVLKEAISSGVQPTEIIRNKNLFQISDAESLEGFIDKVIAENPSSIQAYKAGKENALMFLVGQVMKKSGGKANPKVAQQILKRRIKDA